MNKKHLLLAFLGTVSMSVVAVGLANYEYNNLAINLLATASEHHFTIDKDTTIVKGSSQTDYIFPRGEGTDDDMKSHIKNTHDNVTTFVLNHSDAFFFVPDFYFDDDWFEFWYGVNNLVHFRIDYYLSENDSDNTCTVEIDLFCDLEHRFVETTYSISRGAGYYEWTRPAEADSSLKASSLFFTFYHFRGDPTFRIVKIELDWIC